MKTNKNITNNQNAACIGPQCRQAIRKVRRIRPIYWLGIVAVLLILFAARVPTTVWKEIWVGIKANKLMVTMMTAFGLVSVSLIWAAGQKIDALVFTFFNTHGQRPRWLDGTMMIVTELGNGIVTAVIAVVFYFVVNQRLSYKFVFGTLTLWLLVELIKVLIRRARPFSMLTDVRVVGSRARGNSFPSGHTSQAFYTATFTIHYLGIGILGAVILYFVALLVGVTRMYMGMHYPRDVLAGAVFGSFWGLIGVIINSYIFG